MGRVMRGDLFVCILDPVIQSQYKEGILAFLLLRCNICIVMLIMICLFVYLRAAGYVNYRTDNFLARRYSKGDNPNCFLKIAANFP